MYWNEASAFEAAALASNTSPNIPVPKIDLETCALALLAYGTTSGYIPLQMLLYHPQDWTRHTEWFPCELLLFFESFHGSQIHQARSPLPLVWVSGLDHVACIGGGTLQQRTRTVIVVGARWSSCTNLRDWVRSLGSHRARSHSGNGIAIIWLRETRG